MSLADPLLAGDQGSATFQEAVDTADAADVAAVLALAGHLDPNVRLAVALTLPLLTHGDPPPAGVVPAAIGTRERSPGCARRCRGPAATQGGWR